MKRKRSEETKQKMRENHSHYWLGKKHSEETKEKMSISRMGNKNAKGLKHTNTFIEKMKKRMSGQNNPKWRDGVTPERTKIWKSEEYQNWRTYVFKRDNFICQMCGKQKSGKMTANHIKKFSDYPELRYEKNNGITLCSECHYCLVNGFEKNWEFYFNKNLEDRGYLQI